MLWLVAWRNVWRNKKRSVIIICAIGCGLWAGLLTSGLWYGMAEQMVQSAIADRTAHLQIHLPGFRDHREIDLVLPSGGDVPGSAEQIAGVAAGAGRSVIQAMATSPSAAYGVTVYGVDPAREVRVSRIYHQIIDGTYFESSKRNPIVVGEELADELGVGLGKKIVLTAQGRDGSISAGAFKIAGLFKTVSSEFDKATVFALREDVDRTFSLNSDIHEIALLVDDINRIDSVRARVASACPELEVVTWKELAPDMALMTDTSTEYLMIFLIIILIALAFSITNTMLMAVLERVRELGVMIALGMSRGAILFMIVLETIYLAIIGAVFGLGFSAATISILARSGIDLSLVSRGLAYSGISSVVYPLVPGATYPVLAMMVLLTAIAAGLYPAVKAVRLKPVEAIRTY
jgi:ABC-type lipoprotein release transport system permease subunit